MVIELFHTNHADCMLITGSMLIELFHTSYANLLIKYEDIGRQMLFRSSDSYYTGHRVIM